MIGYNKSEIVGKMRERVILQNRIITQSDSGFQSEIYNDIGIYWSKIEYKTGFEEEDADKITNQQKINITLRYNILVNVNSRFVYRNELYQVEKVEYSDDRRFMTCVCVWRSSYTSIYAGSIFCSASLLAQSSLSAALMRVIKYQASLNAFGSVSADIALVQNVASSLNAFGTLTGDINFVQKVQASLLTSANVTGDITIPKLLNASLLATGTTAADLTVGSAAISVDYLVVAGGGGGGVSDGGGGGGGGGGAGGARCTVNQTGGGGLVETPITLSTGVNYSIIIGGGGTGGAGGGTGNFGSNGNNTVFNNIISIGGGGGGKSTTSTQGRIPSGGGGWSGSGVGLGAIGTLNQSFAGGNGSYPNRGAGGGGGSNQIGQDAINSPLSGGKGGDGITTNITGTNIIYAGGGGGASQNGAATGGTGGAGGGGRGGYTIDSKKSTDGSVNTGGGGGGDTRLPLGFQAGSGGSGIIVLKIIDTITATFSAGVTQTTSISGGFKIITVTAAGISDTVTFS